MNQPAANQPLPAPLIWGETNVGKQRSHNEDQVYPDSRHKTSLRPPAPQAVQARGYLLVVADGIGGAQVGDTAANFAVRSVTDHYYADPRPLPLDKLLQSAVEVANTNVYNYVRTSPAFQQAGCTLTAAAILGSQLVVAHVGDSRAYLLQDGKLYPLTTDHNVAQMMASGQPLPGGGQGLAGNMLVRSLGAGPAVEVDTKPFMLRPGDTVLLCSDGLHSVVTNDEILQIAAKETPEKGARKLIDLANARGGPDNISVVIARVPGGVAAAAPAGAKSSNRLTALALAVLALLGVLAVMLFALNRHGGPDSGPGATTETVVVSVAGADTATLALATETASVPPAAGDTPISASTPAAIAAVPTEASTLTPTRLPTATPLAETPTPARPPTATPRPPATPTPAISPQPTGGTVLTFAPRLLAPPNGLEQRNEVVLQWDHDGLKPGQQYRVDLRTDRNQEPQTLPLSSEGTSLLVRFDDTPQFFKDDNTTYFWRVVVVNTASGIGASKPSEEWRFVMRRDLPQQSTPARQTPEPQTPEPQTPEPQTPEPQTPEPPKTPPSP